MIHHFKAIFFDAGGTLLYPHPSVGEIYQTVAARHGCSAEAAFLERLFRSAWQRRDGLNDFTRHATEKDERTWWREIVHEVISEAGGIEDFENFFGELYEQFGGAASWRLFPETLEVIHEIRKRGKKIVIVSNWDSRLFRICEEFQIRHLFEDILASAVVGASKPNRAIFDLALKKAGVEASEAVHIGDSMKDDIQGALAAGIHAIWINRHQGHPSVGVTGSHQTIQNLRELLS